MEEILHQLLVYPIIYRVLHIQCRISEPSTVPQRCDFWSVGGCAHIILNKSEQCSQWYVTPI